VAAARGLSAASSAISREVSPDHILDQIGHDHVLATRVRFTIYPPVMVPRLHAWSYFGWCHQNRLMTQAGIGVAGSCATRSRITRPITPRVVPWGLI